MKNAYCLFYLCNFLIEGRNKRKTFYHLKIRKVNHAQKNRIYEGDNNYSYLDQSRNSEYEEILNEIIHEYEKEEKKNDKISQEETQKSGHNRENNKSTHYNVQGNKENICSTIDKEKKTQNNTHKSTNQDEIKRIENFKEKNFLNLCNINYDVLSILLKKELEDFQKEEEYENNQYNKISLFLETQVGKHGKGTNNLYIDDNVGRYLIKMDNKFINSISQKELHVLRNRMYKQIIHLKYQYLKSYKNAIHNLKQVREKRTQQINKYVSVVYEEDDKQDDESRGDYSDEGRGDHNDEGRGDHNDEDRGDHNDEGTGDHNDEGRGNVRDSFKYNAAHGERRIDGEQTSRSIAKEFPPSSDKSNCRSKNDLNKSTTFQMNNLGRDKNSNVSYLKQYSDNSENLEQIDKELSIENIKEIMDVDERLSKLQKNFDDLKSFNIFHILNRNNFLNNLRIHNFYFHNYDCPLLFKSMKSFVKKIQKGCSSGHTIHSCDDTPNDDTDRTNNNGAEKEKYESEKHEREKHEREKHEADELEKAQTFASNNCAYMCVPKIRDLSFLKHENKSIVINLSSKEDKEKEHLPPVNELNIETDKGILVLSANGKHLDVNVRNICDKISYLTQSLSICPQLDYQHEGNDLRNIQIMKRILMLVLFYFNIKNMFVICLDNVSAKFFYNFLNSQEDNLFKNLYTTEKEKKNDKDEYLYVNLNDVKFSHILNKKFVPLYNVKNIFKNYVFLMNKEDNFYNISTFKRSCLFMFLDEQMNKQNHVISSSVQHFFYYKKFDYPFIYNIDKKFSLNTLRNFNEILLYLTSWIDIFHTGENETNDVKEDEHEQVGGDDVPSSDLEYEEKKIEKDQEEEEFIQNMKNKQEDENDDYPYEKDERECDGEYGSYTYDHKKNDHNMDELER
ncbi:hypothetical protein, conserved [Plasmodium gonderi]|uniref:Uncharacterized protein n=1 Tax=Plasmodium gonderi TaxID=77519 RepID=A0A1Y1JM86_PLAGO|nr:hypothetical protein, conserved [Plasmodium gonderi]GAW81942.1 hypothetical protein, conserved [Plasmodium gonderi]